MTLPKIFKLGRICNENTVKSERTYKFLDIYLDEYLSFDTHCDHISAKLAISNFIINRVKNIPPSHTLKTLYLSLFHSHLLYGLPIYSCTTQKNINRIYNLQKKAIRTITKSRYNDHVGPLFAMLKILPLDLLITQTKGLLVHSILYKYSPTALRVHNSWLTNQERDPNYLIFAPTWGMYFF